MQRMDWRNAADYSFDPPLSREEWAWQFLRRNRVTWQTAASSGGQGDWCARETLNKWLRGCIAATQPRSRFFEVPR